MCEVHAWGQTAEAGRLAGWRLGSDADGACSAHWGVAGLAEKGYANPRCGSARHANVVNGSNGGSGAPWWERFRGTRMDIDCSLGLGAQPGLSRRLSQTQQRKHNGNKQAEQASKQATPAGMSTVTRLRPSATDCASAWVGE